MVIVKKHASFSFLKYIKLKYIVESEATIVLKIQDNFIPYLATLFFNLENIYSLQIIILDHLF